MDEKPAFEEYPVSDEEMGGRYRNWTEALSRQVVVLYRIGKEVGGEEFVERVKQEFRRQGKKGAPILAAMAGCGPEEFADCGGMKKILDMIDDNFANFWDGYAEDSPQAFEKELKTCPVARNFSKEPELCDVLFATGLAGMLEELNPKLKSDGFSELLTRGDGCCRYRIEMEE
jgi:hypothetical protein